MRLDLFESLPSRRFGCRASTTNSAAKSRSTSLYNAGTSSRGGCRALQLYIALQRSRALYISTALQRSTLYILYTLPQSGVSLLLVKRPPPLARHVCVLPAVYVHSHLSREVGAECAETRRSVECVLRVCEMGRRRRRGRRGREGTLQGGERVAFLA